MVGQPNPNLNPNTTSTSTPTPTQTAHLKNKALEKTNTLWSRECQTLMSNQKRLQRNNQRTHQQKRLKGMIKKVLPLSFQFQTTCCSPLCSRNMPSSVISVISRPNHSCQREGFKGSSGSSTEMEEREQFARQNEKRKSPQLPLLLSSVGLTCCSALAG